MALILEVLQGGRHPVVRERHRLDAGPLAIGRALDNQVVLDDPHVDARHARLEQDAEGGWVLVDLGSLNRIGQPHGGCSDRVVARAGMTVVLGRTTLRFRDEFAPIPAALPLMPVATMEPAWLAEPRTRNIATVGALVIYAITLWLGTTTRGAASQVFATLMAALVLLAMWGGIWSIAARVVLGRFNFLVHVAIASVALAVIMLLVEWNEWMQFLFPAMDSAEVVMGLGTLGVAGLVIASHLAASSHLSRAARWRAAGAAIGVVIALGIVAAVVEDEEYTAIATFAGEIKTIRPSLVPQQDPDAFAAVRADLKAAVDSLLAKP